MRNRVCQGVLLAAALWGFAAPAPAAPATEARPIATGVWLVPEVHVEDREPDGNSVVFEAPRGLIVLDSGRHRWHQEALLAFATARHQPIVAVLNSHWHLDHTSGNRVLREHFPQLKVYATDAIDEALGGFLAASAERAPRALADASIPEAMREDIGADLERIRDGASLRPDIVIRASRRLPVGGRTLRVYVERNAATAADLWVLDELTRTAALGDLVTLPAPYLDTACPDGWSAALARIDASPFERAVPGHGPLLQHAEVTRYRQAFDDFVACSRSSQDKAACAAGWSTQVSPLLAGDASRARAYAEYYVDLLRNNGGRSAYCHGPKT